MAFEFYLIGENLWKNPKKAAQKAAKSLKSLVAGVGFEPTTFRL